MLAESTQITRATFTACLLGLLLSASGCISDQYRYGTKAESNFPIAHGSHFRVNYGRKQPFLDRVEKFVQHPLKTIGHRIGVSDPVPEPDIENDPSRTESVLLAKKYLEEHGLSDVQIDVRSYQPKEQWRRLQANNSTSSILKYTDGAIHWLRYKLLPHRPLHDDHYNPYTNTLYVNSPDPVSTLYQAAMAKKYREKRYPGLYSALQWVPFVPVFHHTEVSNEALSYAARQTNDQELLDELYPHAYAQVGTSAISGLMSSVPKLSNQPFYVGPIVQIAGGAASRKTGSYWANRHKIDSKSIQENGPNSAYVPSPLVPLENDR